MNRKQLVAAAALAAGVAGGSIAGAMIGAPSPSSAIEAVDEEDGGRPGRWGFGHRLDLAVAAEAIGVSEDDLRSALEDGQSIAEVAAANDVDAQVVIDALVADANARLDDAVADGNIASDRADAIREDLTERITEVVNGEAPLGRRGGPGHCHGPGLEVAAETIGISVEDLRTALADGQSVAEVATANDVDPQAVIDALVAQATERITEFVNGEDD